MFSSSKRVCICLLAAMCLPVGPLFAQATPRLTRMKTFSTLNGTVDFLPGAWVRVRQDSRSTYYALRGSKFLPAKPPALIREWQSFDWQSVDFLNQIAIQNYDPDLNHFLPNHKRVKKVVEISLAAHHETLVLICYTEKATEQFSETDDTDIYVTAVLRKSENSHTAYKLLWTRKIEADASYGDFALQTIPYLGHFVVLYWASMGGSGGQDVLNIYRLNK